MTNVEFKQVLEKRTVAFSVQVLKMLRRVPIGIESRNIKDQVARSATAVGANYREANRAESRSCRGRRACPHLRQNSLFRSAAVKQRA